MSKARFSEEVQGLAQRFGEFLERLAVQLEAGDSADKVERDLLAGLLAIGRASLLQVLSGAGTGDLGASIELAAKKGPETYSRSIDLEPRILRTIFGDVGLARYRYVGPDGACRYPLDAELALSKKDTTPLRQEWIERFAVNGSFRKAVETLDELLGISMSVKTAEEIIAYRAEGTMEFRAGIESEPTPKDKLLVAAFDDKGVRMLKPRESGARKRRDPGEKPGNRKMATVGTIYETEPWKDRVLEDIASVLRPEGKSDPRPPAENKHVLARISERDVVFAELRREAEHRLRQGMTLYALMDGGESLERSFWDYFGDIPNVVLLLDFWHLREHVWEAAHALEPRSKAERERWLETQSLFLLQGRASVVVGNMRHSLAKRKLSATRRAKIQKTIDYMVPRLYMMQYHVALKAGAPIGSGAVEGACAHAVGDRMELTGMRWQRCGAQAVLDLRSIHISGLKEQHRQFLQDREARELHEWYYEMAG